MGTLFIKILRIFVVLVVLFSGAMGYVISEKTLAAWWIPVGVALAAGMLTLPLYRKWIWLTTMENRIECALPFGVRRFRLLCIVPCRQLPVG